MFFFEATISKIDLNPMEDLSDFAIIFDVKLCSPHQCSIITAKKYYSYYYYNLVPKLGPSELKASVLYPFEKTLI